MFVSDLRQAGGFFPGTQVSSTNNTDRHDIAELLLKVALSTIKHPPTPQHKSACTCTKFVSIWGTTF